MPRFLPPLALVVFAGFAPAADAIATFPDAKHGKGELTHVQGTPVLVVRGTPAEMGEQFGVLAVKNAPDLDGLQKNFLKDVKLDQRFGFLKLLARRLKPGFPADHMTEIETAAKTAGRDLDLSLFANTVYDLSSGMGCSTVVVEKERSTTGAPLFGRNFDWMPSQGIVEHTLVVVYHPQGKRSFATITVSPIAGCISGMNDAGLAITLNEIHLKQSKDKAEFDWQGTPTMLAFRRVLEECGTVAEAEKLLRGMKRATAACMTICDKEGGAVFEITPKAVEVRTASNHVCLCTNHFRCDALGVPEVCWRYDALAPLQSESCKLGVGDVFARLDKVTQGKYTLQSMVFEPAARTLHLKYGYGGATKLEAKTFALGKWFDTK